MADGWGVQVQGLTELRQRIQRMAQQAPATFARVVDQRFKEAVTFARTRYLSGGTTADRLAVRTGALYRSFAAQVQRSSTGVTANLGYLNASPEVLAYARVHEGWPDNRSQTVIRPRNGQYLTIPLRAANISSGARAPRARDFSHTFVQRSRRGNLLIFQRQGRDIVPLFVLKTEVIVPARPALRYTLAHFLPLILQDLSRELVRG